MVDVRDLAGWTIRLLEDERSGPFNATSPPDAHTFSSMLDDCGAEDVVWVTQEFMAEHGVEGWSDLPCWIPSTDADHAAFQLVPVDRAVDDGLTFRPLAETARDVPEWTGKAGLTAGARGGAAAAGRRGVPLDVAAARARFSALQRDLVFFDGPGGTQVPTR